MKRFLYSTLIFTGLSIVVQYMMDMLYPPDGGPAPAFDLSSLTNIDALMNDPVAMNAVQQQLSLTGGSQSLTRMIEVTVVTTILLLTWPTLRRAWQAMQLRRRGLYWEKNTRFLNVVPGAEALEENDNPLLVRDDEYYVKNFAWRGVNVSATPLAGLGGFIRSGKTKQSFPLLLDGQPITDQSRIAPDTAFVITAALRQPGTQPLTTKTFLKRFGEFDFVFDYNGYRYKHRFALERIAFQLKKRTRDLRRS